jgi:uncharacterized protein YoxC
MTPTLLFAILPIILPQPTLTLLVDTQSVPERHAIFENIGYLAGALSYLHVQVTVDLTSVDNLITAFKKAVSDIRHTIARIDPDTQQPTNYYETQLKNQLKLMKIRNIQILDNFDTAATNLRIRLESLTSMLPKPKPSPAEEPTENTRSKRSKDKNNSSTFHHAQKAKMLSDTISTFSRGARFLGSLSTGLGFFGTFMGLYNKQQIDILRTELDDTNTRMNKLVDVTKQLDSDVKMVNSSSHALMDHIKRVSTSDPALIVSTLTLMKEHILHTLDIITHTIQTAQHRRLAVDTLTPKQLYILYQRIKKTVANTGYQLLTEQPSDLFQLETSYFHNSNSLQLLIHVPMVPNGSLLRLFRLIPFPIPITKQHVLTPVVKDDVLALSAGMVRQSAIISHNDLQTCHNVNNIYLCDKQGVLKTDISSTCLGALYQQEFSIAQKLCPFQVSNAEETVKQLLNNWFIALTTRKMMAPVTCYNGTNSELSLQAGVKKFYLSPGCQTKLDQHFVISDMSLRIDSDIMTFEWPWDNSELIDSLDDLTNQLQQSGITTPTLEEIIQISQERRTRPSWISFSILAAFVLLISMCLAISIFIARRKFSTITNKILSKLPDYHNLLNRSITTTAKSILRRPSTRSTKSTNTRRAFSKSSPNLHDSNTSSQNFHDSDNEEEEHLFYEPQPPPKSKPRHISRSNSMRL